MKSVIQSKSIVIIVVTALLMVVNGCDSDTDSSTTLSISPPFENINVEALEFSIDNTKDTLIALSNGTSLNIPKNAFITKSGEIVKGSVNIQFKQFDTPSKVIASGIPMTYTDEAGNQQQMESAGMFDIRGFSNNQEIVIKEDKNIEVNLASKVDGDYDFFYFEEDETGTKGEWNTLLKNTIIDSNKESIGKTLLFDTLQYSETKLLTNVKFNISKKGADGSSDWIYDQKWDNLDISKPSFYPSIVNRFKSNVYGEGTPDYLSPDSSLIVNFYDKKIHIRNWKGKLVKVLNKRDYSWGYFTNNIFIAYDHNNHYYDFYNSNWELVNSLNEVYNLRTLKDRKYHVYTNISKTNNTHFFVDILDASGGLIKSIACKKHPRSSHNYGWGYEDKRSEGVTDFEFKKDLLLLNTGDGVQIYDLTGAQLKELKYSDTFSDAEFLDYNNAILLTAWDKTLTVWDWKNDQFIKMPKEINPDNYIDKSDHPKQPVLLISNRGAKFFLLWNWKKNTFSKHTTSHKLDQIDFSYDGAYIDEHNWSDDKYMRLWDHDGNEIIKIKKVTDTYASIRLNDLSNTIVSNNHKEFCIYQPNGKLIKKFELSDSTYSEASDYKDKFMLYNHEGFLSFFNSKGLYLKSLQLDKESNMFWYQNYFNSLIVIRTPFNSNKFYTDKGELKYNFGMYYTAHINNKHKEPIHLVFSHERQEMMIIKEGEKLKRNNEYQLILKNKESEFIGKIILDFNTKKAIEKYQEEYLKNYRVKKKKEVDRKERESKLIRSFKVKKFGIYNWDRMYKQPNAVLCKAKLVLNKSSNLEAYGSFLITGEKKNTVIKYSGLDIDKFAFDPTSFNQLLMILPGDKVALLSNEDFKKIKTDNLTEESELVLNLKELGKVESLNYLNSLIN